MSLGLALEQVFLATSEQEGSFRAPAISKRLSVQLLSSPSREASHTNFFIGNYFDNLNPNFVLNSYVPQYKYLAIQTYNIYLQTFSRNLPVWSQKSNYLALSRQLDEK